MPSLLCLLFHDASSDHAFLFLCVSMPLDTDLSTQEALPTQEEMSTQCKMATQERMTTQYETDV